MKVFKKSSMRVSILLLAAILVAVMSFSAVLQPQSVARADSKRDLEEAAEKFQAAVSDMDAEAMAKFWVKDFNGWYPAGLFFGRQANLDIWTFVFTYWIDAGITVDEVVVANSKDVGYTTGLWAAHDPEVMDAGNYVMTWVRTDDGWKITTWSCHLNPDIDPNEVLNQ